MGRQLEQLTERVAALEGMVIATAKVLDKMDDLLSRLENTDVPSDVVRTKRLEVVDRKGRVRAILGDLFEGDPGIELRLGSKKGDLSSTVSSVSLSVLDDHAGPSIDLGYRGNIVASFDVDGMDLNESNGALVIEYGLAGPHWRNAPARQP